MRRPLTVEWMLLTTVVLWALNFTVTRFELTNGFRPLAYSGVIRYGGGALGLLLPRAPAPRRSGDSGSIGRTLPLLVFARGASASGGTSSRSSSR